VAVSARDCRLYLEDLVYEKFWTNHLSLRQMGEDLGKRTVPRLRRQYLGVLPLTRRSGFMQLKLWVEGDVSPGVLPLGGTGGLPQSLLREGAGGFYTLLVSSRSLWGAPMATNLLLVPQRPGIVNFLPPLLLTYKKVVDREQRKKTRGGNRQVVE